MTFIMHTDRLLDDFEEGKRRKRNAVLNTNFLWPGGIVPYEISSYFNGESLMQLLELRLLWCVF